MKVSSITTKNRLKKVRWITTKNRLNERKIKSLLKNHPMKIRSNHY